jgi:hypothetical protein
MPIAATAPEEVGSPEASAPSETPPSHRGLLLMPYGGMQFRLHGPTDALRDCRPDVCGSYQQQRFQTAYRFGVLVGKHLTKSYSLGGEFGFAGWRLFQDEIFPSDPGMRVYQFDFNVTALRHMRWSWGELVVGPKLGLSVLRGSKWPLNFHSIGPLAAARIGLFAAPARWVSLGLLADLTYLRCLDTNNALASVAAAALF